MIIVYCRYVSMVAHDSC